jgi:hypothetical protein
MSKHLSNEEIENRLGAVMNAYKEENSNSVFNMNCVASLLENGGYIIDGDIDKSKKVAESIRRLTGFVNRISNITHKGSEHHDLDSQIDDNHKFWENIAAILNP